MSDVARIKFISYPESVTAALDAVGAAERMPDDGLIIVKPNLTNADPPPVTTPVAAAEAVVNYCRSNCAARVVIGEGSGSGRTIDTYAANGYVELAERLDLELIDFNEAPSVELSRPDALDLKRFHLPEIAREAFVISLPILKDHSFTGTTIAMKNMFGLAPEPFYGGSWNKSKLHSPSTDRSVFDICGYKAPALCVVDAVTALTGMHLAGTPKRLGLMLASFDPVAVDAVGSRLLGHDPNQLEYLTLADGVLGSMADVNVIEG
ncbi:hypothetical protein LCGC14_1230320 [marine sediment metagenome]|uniref:DUF362 domain-containing protein n=1 Tax=marine sediment metagenome TaxID=412755 RepID=A0A0F9PD16_9ZZZZ